MLNRRFWMGALAGLMSLTTLSMSAQEGGAPQRRNFDPEQIRQRMLERYREQLEVKDDAEWKVIAEKIEKVSEARREMGGGMFGRGRGGPGGGGGGEQGGGRERARGLGGDAGPEAEALQQAIDSKASADEIKAKLAKHRETRKAKQEKLDKAQNDLRQLLSVRQEAIAVLNGLLN